MAASGKIPLLPPEYQQVEWIGQANQYPYINTTRTLSNGSVRIATKFVIDAAGQYGNWIIGTLTAGNNNNNGIFIYRATDATLMLRSSTNRFLSLPLPIGKIAEVDWSVSGGNTQNASCSATVTIDGVTESYSGSLNTIAYNKSFYLLGNTMANGAYAIRGKMYYAKVWNDGEPFIDAIPCYRKADGAICMYDLVADTFLQKSGSGTFIKGPDVN